MPERIIYFGPPGTGKTTTLLERMTEELKSVPPDRIAFLTFTRRARHEAVTRVEQVLGIKAKELPYFRTIHSMAFRALGLKEGDIVGLKELRGFGETLGLSFGEISASEQAAEGLNSQSEGDHLLALHHLARVRGFPLKKMWQMASSPIDWMKVAHFDKSYNEFKRASGLLDFTDVLTEFNRKETILPLDIAFIDEAQDLSSLQWLAALQATAGCIRQYIAGDDDQAIYRWAGADVNFFMSLDGERRILSVSHRLPRSVHHLAGKISSRIKTRVKKEFSPREEDGQIIRHSTLASVDASEGEWLWLVRNRFLIPGLRGTLEQRGIVFSQHGQSSITQSDMEAIYGWEHLRQGKPVEAAQIRIVYSKMLSGTQIARGHKLLPKVEDDQPLTMKDLTADHGLLTSHAPWFDTLVGIPLQRRMYYRAVLAANHSLRVKPRIQLETIHGSKGAEAPNVVVFLEQSRRVWQEQQSNADDEHRVWYVAATRARDHLHVVESDGRWSYAMPDVRVAQ